MTVDLLYLGLPGNRTPQTSKLLKATKIPFFGHERMLNTQIFISIARMHHISNPSKFRRLKRHAIHANVSGLVKTGKPGVLVFEGSKESISTFLENVRVLRYLQFQHVDTQPLAIDMQGGLAQSKVGLREVVDMRALVDALDQIGLKPWFRTQMSMDKGPP
ncbi:hypothetical protein D9615_004302 [Tricholomella constricta]|uniref:Uncharacterized protein n=1 Tax=Tricholomella constricta TaxID=117010 RepID=A0A8H5HF28_9AGAR|nr:hypothetical protein D9615_004302 [Tricholomella constricta]